LRGRKEIGQKKPSRVSSEDFDEKAQDRVEKDKEPEDLPVKRLSLFHPAQKEKEDESAHCLVELGRMEGDVQLR